MFEIKIPKILFLALDIASFYRNNFFNTNDLAELSNQYKHDLVRLRADKKDYKYLEDTRFGGLRGNFSTLLTWRGLVKRGSRIVNSYSLGRDNRLLNAICNGKIILDKEKLTAYTNDEKLKELLDLEAWLLNVRESQAHVKEMLRKHAEIPLQRDNNNFPKEAVFKSSGGQYFIRSLINNFSDASGTILDFSIINLWEGKKFHKKNMHPLFVLPTEENPWSEIYAIKIEDLYANKPMLVGINLTTKECKDKDGNNYKLYSLADALTKFSKENDNVENRLNYKWEDLKKQYCEHKVDYEVRKEDEFSNFLKLFLRWSRTFSIGSKDVIDVKVISSGGPDVELIFSGGTNQKLELEHSWNSYLDHGHQNNEAFKNVWIFSEEYFEFKKILKLFSDQKVKNNDRIPDVFLSVDKDGKRHAHLVDWENKTFKELETKF
jgi:hypothetical protein